MVIIDIAKYSGKSLLAGRKNGRSASKTLIGLANTDRAVFALKCNKKQTITSSFFNGLFEDALKCYSSADDALAHFDISGLSQRSKDQFERLIFDEFFCLYDISDKGH